MWKRHLDLNDPLLKAFYNTYHLNLLSLPREKASIGDIYIDDGRRISSPGNITYFLKGNERFELPPTSTEYLSEVTGIVSNNVAVGVGFSFLEGFFGMLGAGDILSKLRIAYRSSNIQNIRFRFTQATRDYIDIFLLGNALYDQRVNENNAAYNKDDSYYLTTAVARAPSINIVAEGNNSKSINTGIKAMQITDATTDVKVEKINEGEITVAGKRSLAFGVELHELAYDPKKQTINIRPIVEGGMKIRNDRGFGILERNNRKVIPSFIRDRKDTPFLTRE
jgi:hypothetical protein